MDEKDTMDKSVMSVNILSFQNENQTNQNNLETEDRCNIVDVEIVFSLDADKEHEKCCNSTTM